MDATGRRTRSILILILFTAAVYRFTYLAFLKNDPLPYHALTIDIYDQSRFMNLAKDILEQGGRNALRQSRLYCPAYSFLIAFIYTLFGQHLMHVFIFQSVIGIMAVYLMFKAGQYLFDSETAGLLAAGIMALYSPLVFYEGTLLRASLLAYINLAGFYFLLRGCREEKWFFFICGGLFMGLSFTLRQHFLPIFILLYLAMRRNVAGPKRIVAFISCALSLALVIMPFLSCAKANNKMDVKSTGLSIFWIGNTHDSIGIGLWRSPLRGKLAQESEGRVLKTGEVFWREIREHPRVYLSLYARKMYMLFNAYEIPANICIWN